MNHLENATSQGTNCNAYKRDNTIAHFLIFILYGWLNSNLHSPAQSHLQTKSNVQFKMIPFGLPRHVPLQSQETQRLRLLDFARVRHALQCRMAAKTKSGIITWCTSCTSSSSWPSAASPWCAFPTRVPLLTNIAGRGSCWWSPHFPIQLPYAFRHTLRHRGGAPLHTCGGFFLCATVGVNFSPLVHHVLRAFARPSITNEKKGFFFLI